MTELVKSLGIEWSLLIAQVVNFAILLFILQRFAYKPVMRLLDERREGAVKALEREEHSAKHLAEAEADREKILASARVESQKILETAKQDGEQLKKKILGEAQSEIARMRSEADKRLAGEKVKLVAEARRELGSIVVTAIEGAFGDALDAHAQGRMTEQALAAIREGEKTQ